MLHYGYYSGVGGNNSAQLLIYYNFMYIINPRICARFGLVTSYTLHHHLTTGGEGDGYRQYCTFMAHFLPTENIFTGSTVCFEYIMFFFGISYVHTFIYTHAITLF